MKAVEIKRMPRRGAMADQRLFECEPGGLFPRFVIVSAVVAMFTGPETYVFASDESGEVKKLDRTGRVIPRGT